MAAFLLASFLLGGIIGFAGRPAMPPVDVEGDVAPL